MRSVRSLFTSILAAGLFAIPSVAKAEDYSALPPLAPINGLVTIPFTTTEENPDHTYTLCTTIDHGSTNECITLDRNLEKLVNTKGGYDIQYKGKSTYPKTHGDRIFIFSYKEKYYALVYQDASTPANFSPSFVELKKDLLFADNYNLYHYDSKTYTITDQHPPEGAPESAFEDYEQAFINYHADRSPILFHSPVEKIDITEELEKREEVRKQQETQHQQELQRQQEAQRKSAEPVLGNCLFYDEISAHATPKIRKKFDDYVQTLAQTFFTTATTHSDQQSPLSGTYRALLRVNQDGIGFSPLDLENTLKGSYSADITANAHHLFGDKATYPIKGITFPTKDAIFCYDVALTIPKPE